MDMSKSSRSLRNRMLGLAALVAAALVPFPAEAQVTVHPLGGWHGWDNLGGNVARSAGFDCLARPSNGIDCFALRPAVNGTSEIEHLALPGALPQWSPLQGVAPVINGPASVIDFADQRPGCVSIAAGRFDCAIFAAVGQQQSLFHIWRDGASAGWWEDIGLRETVASYPSCAIQHTTAIRCFFRLGDGTLGTRLWDGHVWTGGNFGGTIAAPTAPECTTWNSGTPSTEMITCIFVTTVQTVHGPTRGLRSVTLTQSTAAGAALTTLPGSSADLPIDGTQSVADPSGDFQFPSQPKCASSAGTLFCVMWMHASSGEMMLARWSTHDGHSWIGPFNLHDDRGASDNPSGFGTPLASAFDCVARGSDRVDCVEVVMRGFRQTAGGGFLNQSLHMHWGGWVSTGAASWTNVDGLTVPVAADLGVFNKMQVRCLSQGPDSLDCFTVAAGQGPLLHAHFQAPPVTIPLH
ncbi:MAG TPA: hypothetical protein VMU08_10040 [Rhizomicrobium sp.]|nr:hypothetical protein [Rhizomicrobium sp.]